MATTFRSTVSEGDAMSWVIERAGRTVGLLMLTVAGAGSERPRRAYVTGLYVEPEQRGRGIGALALRFAGEVGRSLGLKVYATGALGENKLPPSPRPVTRLAAA